MNTGERILAVRKNAGLSQEQFGELFGVSRQSVSRWESNQSLPETTTIIKIAKTFDVSTDYLLCTENSENSTRKAFESISADKMRFHFGCMIIFIGVLLLAVTLIVNHNLVSYWGNPIRMLMNASFISEQIYYLGLTAVIIAGICICWSAVNNRNK